MKMHVSCPNFPCTLTSHPIFSPWNMLSRIEGPANCWFQLSRKWCLSKSSQAEVFWPYLSHNNTKRHLSSSILAVWYMYTVMDRNLIALLPAELFFTVLIVGSNHVELVHENLCMNISQVLYHLIRFWSILSTTGSFSLIYIKSEA